jgi:hypothetical protein
MGLFLVFSSDACFLSSSDSSEFEGDVEPDGKSARSSINAFAETCGEPNDMAKQAALSAIQAGSSRETPCRISTSMISFSPRPLLLVTGNFFPYNGCHR